MFFYINRLQTYYIVNHMHTRAGHLPPSLGGKNIATFSNISDFGNLIEKIFKLHLGFFYLPPDLSNMGAKNTRFWRLPPIWGATAFWICLPGFRKMGGKSVNLLKFPAFGGIFLRFWGANEWICWTMGAKRYLFAPQGLKKNGGKKSSKFQLPP